MKKLIPFATLALIVGVTALGSPREDEKPTAGALAFEKIRALEGTWYAAGDETRAPATIFRVSAGGSAVLETLFPGTEKEMLTVYYLDADRELCLTHYCMLGNQPQMKAKVDGNRIHFGFCGGCNIEVGETTHMHDASYEFVSADRYKTTWNLHSKGKPADAHAFEFVRVK